MTPYLRLTDTQDNNIDISIEDIDTDFLNTSLSKSGNNLVLKDSSNKELKIELSKIDSNTKNSSLYRSGSKLILEDSDNSKIEIPLKGLSEFFTENDIFQKNPCFFKYLDNFLIGNFGHLLF